MTNHKPQGAPQHLQEVMNYAAELELEVDRLRRRDKFLQQEARDHVEKTMRLCSDGEGGQDPAVAKAAIMKKCEQFSELLRDVSEPQGYHPAFDQVTAIAMRPLAKQVFRWQQRLSGASDAVLQLDLQTEHIDWFPARLRHILDNLISNALRYRDANKEKTRLVLSLCIVEEGYELRVTDNGLGIPDDQIAVMMEMFYRAGPSRVGGLGVGLAVVKLLVEQCCGAISVDSGEGQGTCVTVVLPRYELADHVD